MWCNCESLCWSFNGRYESWRKILSLCLDQTKQQRTPTVTSFEQRDALEGVHTYRCWAEFSVLRLPCEMSLYDKEESIRKPLKHCFLSVAMATTSFCSCRFHRNFTSSCRRGGVREAEKQRGRCVSIAIWRAAPPRSSWDPGTTLLTSDCHYLCVLEFILNAASLSQPHSWMSFRPNTLTDDRRSTSGGHFLFSKELSTVQSGSHDCSSC